MQDLFSTDHYGKKNIVSRYGLCDACQKLTVPSSYTTAKFLACRGFPLLPLRRRVHIHNECPLCGHRSEYSYRKYKKQRAKDLAVMMESFSSEPDNPDSALNGLHTLMVYDEESWFMDCTQSYGRHFETHMMVQLKIAEGLCRFGHYSNASTYCRKAIVLGSGSSAEELLNLCQSRLEKKEAGHITELPLQPESMLRPYAFMLTVAASLLISIVANGISAMHNHTIWLVNGAPIPYSVEVDGNRYPLTPYGAKRIKVRLGKHQMQTHGLPGRNLPISFSYKTSLIRQKLENHALVLNPDAMAVMVEETLIEGQKTNHYQFGDVINALEGIDYPFSSFPVWSGTKRSAQTRLFHHIPTNHLELVEVLRTHGNPADAAQYARRALMINPSGPETIPLLEIATHDLPTKEAQVFLRHGTSILPPLPEWHVFYQDLIAALQPEYDLQAEYAELCKAHPSAPLCSYLLGRVVLNRSTAHKFFEKSENGTGSQGRGYHAIAYDLLCAGQFKEALPYVEKAIQKSPDHPGFKELAQQIHLALNQYTVLLQQVEASLESEPDNGEWLANKVKYLTLLGEHKAATEAASSSESTAYYYAARYYAVGNTTDYLECLMASGQKNVRLQQFLHAGDVQAAHDFITQNEERAYTAHLILYCAAKHHGHPGIAESALAKSIAGLTPTTSARREEISMLSSPTAPSVKQLLELRIPPQEKAILCTALGYKFPDRRETFFKLSKKFNHTPEYPQLLLKKWTRRSAPKQ